MEDGRCSQFFASIVELLQQVGRRGLVSLDGGELVVYVRVSEKIVSIVDHQRTRAADFGRSDGGKAYVLVAADFHALVLAKVVAHELAHDRENGVPGRGPKGGGPNTGLGRIDVMRSLYGADDGLRVVDLNWEVGGRIGGGHLAKVVSAVSCAPVTGKSSAATTEPSTSGTEAAGPSSGIVGPRASCTKKL